MSPPDPIDHVRSYMLHDANAASPLRVILEASKSQSLAKSLTVSVDDEKRWSELQASNPRLHDGPILSVNGYDPSRRMLSCRIDSYKRLAIQESNRSNSDNHADPFNPADIWLLGVKGWIIAKDRAGEEHVLIARRGLNTRIYGLMWESAPAGGVQPPSHSQPESESSNNITHDVLRRSLASECEEELGLDLDWSSASIITLTQDSTAHSYDLHFRLNLPTTINPNHAPVCSTGERSWEYVDSAWLSRRDAAEFDRKSGDAITPPTRAMLRAIEWVQ